MLTNGIEVLHQEIKTQYKTEKRTIQRGNERQ